MSMITLEDGTTIWYARRGSGPLLLHIHGSAFGHRNFDRLTPQLTDDFEVIDFDLPGYGDSVGGPKPSGMPEIADRVAALVQALGLAPLHVHGTSFGAMVAVHLAARHPDLVRRLVLSCFLARYDRAARVMRGTWKRAARDSGMDAVADLTSVAGFARRFYDEDWAEQQLASMREAFSRTTPAAFVVSTETIERSDLTPVIPQIKAPTLMLAGEEDNMTPFRPAASGVGMAQIAEILPSVVRTVVLPECGHYLVIEAAAKAGAEIRRFLLSDDLKPEIADGPG